MTQDPFVTLTSPESEKTFEHAITLAAAFVASGKVPLHLTEDYPEPEPERRKTTAQREEDNTKQISDLIHGMYLAVIAARELVNAPAEP